MPASVYFSNVGKKQISNLVANKITIQFSLSFNNNSWDKNKLFVNIFLI